MKSFFRKKLVWLFCLVTYFYISNSAKADQIGDQAKIMKDYYKVSSNEQKKSFANLASFVSDDALDRLFLSNRGSGLLTRLNNNWISNKDSNHRAYNINLDIGYSFVLWRFLITPILEFGFTNNTFKQEIKADLNNWSFVLPGLYAFYGFENGLFIDLFFDYKLNTANNNTKEFENYKKSKVEHGINVRTSLGWNFNFKSSEFYGNLSITPKVAVAYNRLYLNSNNIIAKNWLAPEGHYNDAAKINYNIIYLIPEIKLEFNEMFRGSSLAYAVNFFSLDIKYHQDLGSNNNFKKEEDIFDTYSSKFESDFETTITFGLKTKLGIWYAISFEKLDAIHLDLGYKF